MEKVYLKDSPCSAEYADETRFLKQQQKHNLIDQTFSQKMTFFDQFELEVKFLDNFLLKIWHKKVNIFVIRIIEWVQTYMQVSSTLGLSGYKVWAFSCKTSKSERTFNSEKVIFFVYFLLKKWPNPKNKKNNKFNVVKLIISKLDNLNNF